MATPQDNTYTVSAGDPVVAGYYIVPPWAPNPGQFVTISYAKNAHPLGDPAVLEQISPQYQSWNPGGVGTGECGPWGGKTPSNIYHFTSILSYSGMCFSPELRKYIGYGAGHAAVCIPAPFSFDLETLAWEWLSVPIPSDGFTLTQGVAANAATVALYYPSTQFDTTWGEWIGGYSGWPSGYEQPGLIFPETSHTYNNLMIIPAIKYGNNNGALLLVNSPTGDTTGTDMKTSHIYDFDTRQFIRTANRQSTVGNSAGGMCYDAASNTAYACSNGSSTTRSSLEVLDIPTKTWSTKTCSNISITIESGGMRSHPDSNLIMMFTPIDSGGNPTYLGIKHKIYAASTTSILAGGFTWTVLTVSGSNWPLRTDGTIQQIGWCYCPLDKSFYTVNGVNASTTVWKLAPPSGAVTTNDYLTGTWTISALSMTSGQLISMRAASNFNDSYVYNRVQWDVTSSSFLWTTDYNEGPVQAFRPPGV